MPKSTMAAATVASGTISRGKYTFVMMWEFAIRLGMANDSAVAKNVQGSSAA